MRHPVPDEDTIRLIAALVYSHGGQMTGHRYGSHFATCPRAAKHRKRGRP